MEPKTRRFFFAFPFGDYEGVRAYLNRRAAQGWAFAGRGGLLTARFEATQRTELCYDVVPADPRRTPQQLQEQVQHREAQGWEAVDTLWGMDIYRSLPCRTPAPERSPEEYAHWRRLTGEWLGWSLAFLAVTVLALAVLGRVFSFTWADLTQQWYLSDSRSVLTLALPLLGALALAWLGWLGYGLAFRCKPHKPCAPGFLYLRGGLLVLGLVLVGLTLGVLWLDQIPRLWMRLALGGLLLLALGVGPLLAQGNLKRQTLILGGSLFAFLLLAMVLSWTVSPVELDTVTQGESWRQSAQLPLLRGEDLGLATQEETVNAVYEEEQALLVTQQHYYEHWSHGLVLEVTVYRCHLPGLAALVWQDVLPPAAETEEALAVLSGEGRSQLWYRQGNLVYHLSGTVDWTQEALQDAALQALLP